MLEFFVFVAIGIVLIIFGTLNMRGNISSLHSYHRKRVAEEDVLPFGRRVGVGTLIIGIGMIVAGVLSLIAYFLNSAILIAIGKGVMLTTLIVGSVLIVCALMKYNKGIF